MEQKITIHWNVQLWKVYFFEKNVDYLNESHRESIFSLLTAAASEDIKLFMRFFLYVANTRDKYKELHYKFMCHFLGTLYSDIVIANIELITKLGKKNDVLFFTPAMPETMTKWVHHKAKTDTDYKSLTEGIQIDSPRERIIYFRPKWSKNYKWQYFFEKIASEPQFNGILTPMQSKNIEEENIPTNEIITAPSWTV